MSPSADHEGYRIGPVDASTTVVVVGAGPSGLMLACNLVRFGIAVVILDDRPDKTSTGKADGMQPKTIETFRQLGLADPLLKNGAKVYDISFWESTANESLRRTGRKTHYPEHVGASDPYILLAHQGMVEEVMIDDMEARGVSVTRNSKFVSCSRLDGMAKLDITYEDVRTNTPHKIRADYLVGCDGARSKVRSFIPDAELEGELTNAAWGVLDGVIDTDFPDLWSKVALRSHSAGSILWIPREKGMTRLYVELSSTDGERVEKSKATTEYVMSRAREAMYPFNLEWKTVEWFGTYVVGQRVAKRFMDAEARIFIAGDVGQTQFGIHFIHELTETQAGHCHSALAAQGANTSMHDSFNLAWKLNLLVRGLAKPSLLHTYEAERQKIAYDLINFDLEHCKAFAAGDSELAKNFDDNIRFISGVGAEYAPGMLTQAPTTTSHLQPGMLQLPAKVTRYIDANPVDIQLDVPLLGQFKIYIVVPDVCRSGASLKYICEEMQSIFSGVSVQADQSYGKHPRGHAPTDGFVQAQRYIAVSKAFTFAMVTQSTQSEFEIADLPEILQSSRWTLYVDNIGGPSFTNKWFGDLSGERIGMAVVRPDGYVGAIETWDAEQVGSIGQWLQDYFSFMV
ncbi:Monooxygenase FAD-binding [Penicillium robsamsonii]|uniref:Monooxygenase FAD-binding n=1 Tax=Penicillium robsamsonii TaxID=1792511 RepID=UPI00254848EB|nr:Monooxygenase FAD-binding [Penicillium robsamsonii]KAJ5807622.1 Monooxygenase FAD-binding [Penicillium robsamsonii]